jgi:predicted nucleic-acid-binding Zn-ribbon protein
MLNIFLGLLNIIFGVCGMGRGSMAKCPKCGSVDIRREGGRLERATVGASRLFFDVYICSNCHYSELYFVDKSYIFLGH